MNEPVPLGAKVRAERQESRNPRPRGEPVLDRGLNSVEGLLLLLLLLPANRHLPGQARNLHLRPLILDRWGSQCYLRHHLHPHLLQRPRNPLHLLHSMCLLLLRHLPLLLQRQGVPGRRWLPPPHRPLRLRNRGRSFVIGEIGQAEKLLSRHRQTGSVSKPVMPRSITVIHRDGNREPVTSV